MSRLLAALFLLPSLGCAGALVQTSGGTTILPLTWGNAEYVSDTVCLAGGPGSQGLFSWLEDLVKGARDVFARPAVVVQDGQLVTENEPEGQSQRQAGCLATQAEEELPDLPELPLEPEAAEAPLDHEPDPEAVDAAAAIAEELEELGYRSPGPLPGAPADEEHCFSDDPADCEQVPK